MSWPRSSTARACGSERRPARLGTPWWNSVAWIRCAHAVCSSRRSRYSCSSTRSSLTCSGGIHETGTRPSATSVRRCRESALSVFARFFGPR